MQNTPLNYTEIHDQKYQNDPTYRTKLQYQGHASDSLVWLMDHRDISQYRVLDYGCGPGRNTLALTLKGIPVEVYDPSSVALGDLRSSLEQSRVEKDLVTIQETPTLTKQYDTILLCYVIHFIPPEEAKEIIRSLLASLKSGGYFCFEYFTPEVPWYRTDRYHPTHPEILGEFFDSENWTECFFEQKDDISSGNKIVKEMGVFQKK